MGKIGHFGSVKFRVKMTDNHLNILSFDNMKWNTSINVEEHKVQGKKPKLEIVGRNADEVTMDIYISAYNHVHPMKILLKLRKYNLNGKAYPLVIGGKRIGNFKFIITQISNSMEKFYKNGKLIEVMVSVSFKEYVYKKKKTKKSKLVSNGKKKVTKKKGSSGSNKTGNGTSKKSIKLKGYKVYTVKKGDTLWSLAEENYGAGVKYKKIFNANKTESKGFHKITNPSRILPGWVIKIPA